MDWLKLHKFDQQKGFAKIYFWRAESRLKTVSFIKTNRMGSTAKAAKANGKAKLLQRKEENILHSLSLSLYSRKIVFPVLCFAQTLQLQQVVQLLPAVVCGCQVEAVFRPATPVASGGTRFPLGFPGFSEQLIQRCRCRRRRQKAGNTFDRRAGKADRRFPESSEKIASSCRSSFSQFFSWFFIAVPYARVSEFSRLKI